MEPFVFLLSQLCLAAMNVNLWQAIAGFVVSSALNFSISLLGKKAVAEPQTIYAVTVINIFVNIEATEPPFSSTNV
ncbi:MAG: hypothetical protein AB8B99_25090 [Phormidesmis sp.]